jgi:hypothetical protein
MASSNLAGATISGGEARRDCSAACLARRCQRSRRLAEAAARCESVRLAITGTIRETPSSVHFSIAHSMRSNLNIASRSVISAGCASEISSAKSNSTLPSTTDTIRPRLTTSPVAISNSCPIRARSTRDRCSACSPTRAARSPETSSAIQRRRVKGASQCSALSEKRRPELSCKWSSRKTRVKQETAFSQTGNWEPRTENFFSRTSLSSCRAGI